MPERPETDRQVEGPGQRQGPGVGPDPPVARVRTARLCEHARAEVDPMIGPWHKDLRTRTPAPGPPGENTPQGYSRYRNSLRLRALGATVILPLDDIDGDETQFRGVGTAQVVGEPGLFRCRHHLADGEAP